MTTTAGPLAEINAMQKLAEAFDGLPPDAIERVLRWAAGHYGASVGPAPKGLTPRIGEGVVVEPDAPKFGSLAELCAAASPTTDADRALVAGYWFQVAEGAAEFSAQAVNSALKQLGHGVSNITSAFETLKTQKPALVMQLKKSGTTKQARKSYKLTVAGLNAVHQMIGPN